jgi:hypothetical protein
MITLKIKVYFPQAALAVGVLLLRKLALETVSRVGRMTAKSANRCFHGPDSLIKAASVRSSSSRWELLLQMPMCVNLA